MKNTTGTIVTGLIFDKAGLDVLPSPGIKKGSEGER